MNKLPEKPSALIRLALADLEVVEKNPKYAIDMDFWHIVNKDTEICSVCFAGAVMANTLEAPSWMSHVPFEFESECHKLVALDSFRCGHIAAGLEQLDIDPIEKLWSWNVMHYHIDPIQFKKDMHDMADMLEGLEL